jgi:DNA-binding beta-propeller fold protein YncE
LGKLEGAYPSELAVIGVSSPKYPAEGDGENLRHAVERLSISHPVVNDHDFRVWDSYAVSAWPTLIFIGPQGRVLGRHSGEAHFDALDGTMKQLLAESESQASLNRSSLPYQTRRNPRPTSLLSYPGKVLASADHIFVADSGHHRIVVATHDGTIQRVLGSGEPGLRDGPIDEALFDTPQGMAHDAERGVLYVGDAENHCVRSIRLSTGVVTTVAGTGAQARRPVRRGPARETALSSPWDLALDGDRLFIAMAGLHQVWMLELGLGMVSVWAGTGHEALRDGSREQAWLAQPMGISLDTSSLYIACAETQAIRQADLRTETVQTLAGTGLFDFGDQDGPAESSLLQHIQGVCVSEAAIYIADTYNNKIKLLDRGAGSVTTLAGSGTAGLLDGPGPGARFHEPSGLSLQGQTLFVADTNNHTIRPIDLATGHVGTLSLHGKGLDTHDTE